MEDTNPQEKEGGNQNSQVSTGSIVSLLLTSPFPLHCATGRTPRGGGHTWEGFLSIPRPICACQRAGSHQQLSHVPPPPPTPLVLQGDDLMAIKAKRMAERKAAEAAEAASGSGNPAGAPAEQK